MVWTHLISGGREGGREEEAANTNSIRSSSFISLQGLCLGALGGVQAGVSSVSVGFAQSSAEHSKGWQGRAAHHPPHPLWAEQGHVLPSEKAGFALRKGRFCLQRGQLLPSEIQALQTQSCGPEQGEQL